MTLRLDRRIGKSSSDVDVWIVFYPSMFLNNFRKNVKGGIGVSIVLREFSYFFLSFPAKRRWYLSCDRLYYIRKIETREARQAGYLAGYISAEVGNS